jgi:cell division protein FtsI (penicillin-binding protein 3)
MRDSEESHNDNTTAETVRPSRIRAVLLHLSLIAFAIALLLRAGKVQLVDGAYWAQRADVQHMRVDSLPARRGTIYDARGEKLVVSQELFRLTISPDQVRPPRPGFNERDTLVSELRKLGQGPSVLRKAMDSTSKYLPVRGEFIPSEVARLQRIRGVSSEWVMRRTVSASPGLAPLLGSINHLDSARGGVEQGLDSLLTGQRGSRRALRDPRGRASDSPVGSKVNARPGHSVSLTINQQLQEIVEEALLDAVRSTGAEGGDLVVLDPDDGAILALAGVVDKRIAQASVTPLTGAYEPGSVLKPLFIARLLDDGRVTINDSVDTENGQWVLPYGTFTDDHPAPAMSVFDVVRWSSNIGIAKLVTQYMSPAEEFELLRDYGFGNLSGLPLPGESRGVLRQPDKWTAPSAVSHSIGYEMMVTPVQLAVAYAAVANGGELLEPALVRAVRNPDGEEVFAHERRVVRRVASPENMALVRTMLKAVVDSGTGVGAATGVRFQPAGKTGTSRRQETDADGGRTYNATFAGMFPVESPELVIVARLISPTTSIYGGAAAGPIFREVLRGAMAARSVTVNGDPIAGTAMPPAAERLGDAGTAADVAADANTEDDTAPAATAAPATVEPAPGRVVVSLPLAKSPVVQGPLPVRSVPDVRGLTVRDAVRTLHSAGFHVKMVTSGVAGRTNPDAGTAKPAGSLIVLEGVKR